MAGRTDRSSRKLFALLALASFLAFVPPSSLAVVSCPSPQPYSIAFNGFTYTVTVDPAAGSCPIPYSNSTVLHLALSTSNPQNPYTITIFPPSPCTGTCVPSNIIILGWGNVAICGRSQSLSGPSCSATGPWSGTLSATVQAGQPCSTAPLKFNGNSGQPDIILEAGVGCLGPHPVPQFPLSAILLASALAPVLLLVRRLRSAARV